MIGASVLEGTFSVLLNTETVVLHGQARPGAGAAAGRAKAAGRARAAGGPGWEGQGGGAPVRRGGWGR
jgi:hypothetical protein